jgi:uncharacterized protein YdeI (YjbR/CyaY-like superfamily)
MEVAFFKTSAALRKWLEKNHLTEKELLVGFYKKETGKQSITWPEAVDQALCFGWIDGIRKSIDAESYYNRFTPRKKNSNWSNVNIARYRHLKDSGLTTPAGQTAFDARDIHKAPTASFEQGDIRLPKPIEQQFKAEKAVWQYFMAQPPSVKRLYGG